MNIHRKSFNGICVLESNKVRVVREERERERENERLGKLEWHWNIYIWLKFNYFLENIQLLNFNSLFEIGNFTNKNNNF